MQNLLIVESPAKAKKIQQYLDDSWQVVASYGHIRDLPVKEIGVEAPYYQPDYEITERGTKTISKLKNLAKQASEIYLATDPDREGEAIAWHLAQLLCKNKSYKRITFNEITEKAIKKAIENPRLIDENLFLAQQGRRVLDRLYGYKLSPELGNKLNQLGVSAGRVQSVALRVIVDRERDIYNFVSVSHYGIRLDFDNWFAHWDTSDLVDDDNPYITNKEIAKNVCDAVKSNGITIKSFNEKEQSRKPPAPLITSTLQQAAANTLKMSVTDTMDAAQKLFEAGLITYHRTDNPNLSDESITLIWEFLRSVGQDEHIPDKANKWKSKADAQEAHEAIRPTDFYRRKAETGNKNQDDLYTLIWRVAVASQMKSAIYKVREATLESNAIIDFSDAPKATKRTALFTAKGRELIYQGWLFLNKDDFTSEESNKDENLPVLPVNQAMQPNTIELLDKETKPPKRYSETSLVKLLEREGIGRPSTYANIIQVLLTRNYVEIKNRLFHSTELGEVIADALTNRFNIMEMEYTRNMESRLDAVAQGNASYLDVVTEYDATLETEIKAFKATKIKPFGDHHYSCPECDGLLRRIKGKYGFFWSCSNFNNGCLYKTKDAKGKPEKKENTTFICPSCGGNLRRISSKFGYFWGCSNFSDGCSYKAKDASGKPEEKKQEQVERETEHLCPTCKKGFLQRRPSKKNKDLFWWGCNQFPKCKQTYFDESGKPKIE